MTADHGRTPPPGPDLLSTVVHLGDAALAVYDRGLVLRWANEAYARLLGRDRATLPGTRLADRVGPRAYGVIAAALRDAAPDSPVETVVEIDRPDATGRVLRVRNAWAGDGDGTLPGWVQTVRDVTVERQTEPAARLAAIVESSDDAIVGKTLDGIVTSWNDGARRIFGYAADEMIGQPIRRIMPPDRVADMHRILGRVRAGERVEHFETERVRKDGTRIHVSLTVSPIRDASGRIVGASKIARDVTERRRAESEMAAFALDDARLYEAERHARADAEAASRAKDDLFSVVSHELRTPLTSMLGWVAVLRQGKLDPDGVRRALDTIERNGRAQGELIDDLLDVSRIVAGTMKLEPERLDLRSACEAAVDALRPDASAKGVHLVADLGTSATVVGDPIRLRQVVSNLVANAIRFTPARGHVRVSLATHEDAAEIVVRDDGVGIAPEFLPFVFEPFRQSVDVRRRKCAGLGLGPTIVKNLVGQQGGAVAAASDGPDCGAVFTVRLPLAGVECHPAGSGPSTVERASTE